MFKLARAIQRFGGPSLIVALAFEVACDARPPSPSVDVEIAREPRLGAPNTKDPHAALAKLVAWVERNRGKLGVAVGSAESKTASFDHDAHTPLNPASNMKLVTAAVALDLLGPGFEYTTGIYGEVKDDRIEQLVLRGHGDPSLREADLWRLGSAVAERGIKRVGRVLVDQERFDEQFVPPAFEQQPKEWAAFRAPISAVAVERNTLTLNVLAGDPGTRASIWYTPRGIAQSQGSVETKKRGGGQAIGWELGAEGGKLVSKLSGHVASGLPRLQFSKRVDDPRLLPAQVLTALLRETGIKVDQEPALGGQAVTERLTYVPSPPLAQLVQELGKRSDNFYAEMIFKSLSSEKAEKPASSAASAQLVNTWLKGLGTNEKEFEIKNGSGLFDANRLSAGTLLTVLQHSYQNPQLRHEYLAHLAIGGTDGTLRSRYQRLPKGSKVRAKTGTLNDAITLSGYVESAGTEPPLAFSVMVNGIKGKHAAIRAQIDEFVTSLAGSP